MRHLHQAHLKKRTVWHLQQAAPQELRCCLAQRLTQARVLLAVAPAQLLGMQQALRMHPSWVQRLPAPTEAGKMLLGAWGGLSAEPQIPRPGSAWVVLG